MTVEGGCAENVVERRPIQRRRSGNGEMKYLIGLYQEFVDADELMESLLLNSRCSGYEKDFPWNC